MLFALTDFDENNHVIEKTVGSYSVLVNSFIDATNRCQGRDVYVPIMGTGLSLFGLDHKRAFQIMKDSLIARRDTLKSTVHIVVFKGDKEKLSIFDD